MRPRITVIVATCGRDTLPRTLKSARWANETIVVFNEWGDWGMKARNLGMAWASGTHLCFIDDDDHYTPDAGKLIRAALKDNPDKIHVFDMSIVTAGSLDMGCVGTPMFVVPNRPGYLGRWPDGEYCGDNYFINETAQLQGPPVYHPGECIAVIGDK